MQESPTGQKQESKPDRSKQEKILEQKYYLEKAEKRAQTAILELQKRNEDPELILRMNEESLESFSGSYQVGSNEELSAIIAHYLLRPSLSAEDTIDQRKKQLRETITN